MSFDRILDRPGYALSGQAERVAEESRTRLLELVRPFVPWVELKENGRRVY